VRSFAGSDTTAITLRAVFYFLLRTPAAYAKLLDEMASAKAVDQLSDPVTYDQARRMPYLQACLKEAMRLHPAVGQLIERVVPEEGATILGVDLPAGTIVGVNPWVAARDKAVYGEDADDFRPDRWLTAEAHELKLMERNWLAVSAAP